MSVRHKLDLPIELEREIFEIAAKADIGTALRLAVVARRVQAWIEPIIYSRVVVVRSPKVDLQIRNHRALTMSANRRPRGQESRTTRMPPVIPFIRTVATRPPSFFQRNVKILHVGELTEPELVTILSTCTGISELGWWASTPSGALVTAFDNLALRRLSVDQTYDFKLPGISKHWVTITHLDVTTSGYGGYALHVLPLEQLPALTHFSINCNQIFPAETWRDVVLKTCPRLKILLHFSVTMHYAQIAGSPLHQDPRVVVMFPHTGTGTTKVHDLWPIAEEIVRKRREIAAVAAASGEA